MKKLGQHFVRSEALLKEIVELAEISEEDEVLEIGTGYGNLTAPLAEKAKHVYTIEIDEKLLRKAKERLRRFENITFISGDALKVEWPIANKVVGNLPYAISSPLTERILDYLNEVAKRRERVKAVLMYQKEFALRMVAEPYDINYSRISVLVSHLAHARILRIVPRSFFVPKPRVDSAIVELIPKGVEKDRVLLLLAKLFFEHKNKKLIKACLDSRRYFKMKEKKELKEVLKERLGEYADYRAWELGLKELEDIKGKISDLLESEGED